MSDSGEPPATIRVLVLDEQPLLRYGICAYLNSQLDMSVCGEAGSIPEARSKIAECHPQLLVTALGLGAEDSLKLIRTLRTENPMLRVLVYSAFDETIFAQRAMRAGANGYVMKQAPREELAAAIRDIVKGGIYVSHEAALSAFRQSLQLRPKNQHWPRPGHSLENLSDREMQIFQLLGSGLGPRNIAELLNLSVKTVDSHRENIKHKLHVSSSAELSVYAVEWVEQSLFSEAHTFRGVGQGRKRKVQSLGLRAVEEFTAPVTHDSELAAETATSDSHSSGADPVRAES
jgi:two-component system, NarL family, response regulator FusR